MSMRPLFDDPGSAVPDYATLRVDIAALADLASALRQEINGNLLPHLGPLASAYGMGVKFGLMSHSQNMRLARIVYHGCLTHAIESLANRIAVAKALAAAIEHIADSYRASDAMSEARSSDVGRAIDDAIGATARPELGLVIEQFSGKPGSYE